MSVDPHEGEASDASRSSKGQCPFGVERELREEPRTMGSTITGEEGWHPQPATLRDGETRDDSAHASANREMIRKAWIEAGDQEVREAIEAAEDGGRDA